MERIIKGIIGLAVGLVVGPIICVLMPIALAYDCWKDNEWPPIGS
jgi:ABC-type antimicrobial peptide transport system permease subunit